MNLEKKIFSKKEKNPINSKEFYDTHPEFFEDIGKEIKHENNVITYENEKLKITLKIEEFSDYIKSSSDYPRPLCFEDHTYYKEEDYFRLVEFKLKGIDYEYDLKSEKLKPIVIFKRNSIPSESSGSLLNEEKLPATVMINSRLSSPNGILILMHELGHLNDKNLKNYRIELQKLLDNPGSWSEEMKEQRSAIFLKKERTAWAYALNKIKPFIAGLGVSEESIERHIHGLCLGSYSKI